MLGASYLFISSIFVFDIGRIITSRNRFTSQDKVHLQSPKCIQEKRLSILLNYVRENCKPSKSFVNLAQNIEHKIEHKIEPKIEHNQNLGTIDEIKENKRQALTGLVRTLSRPCVDSLVKRTTTVNDIDYNYPEMATELDELIGSQFTTMSSAVDKQYIEKVWYMPTPVIISFPIRLLRGFERLMNPFIGLQPISLDGVTCFYRRGKDPVVILPGIPDFPFMTHYINRLLDAKRGLIYVTVPCIRLDKTGQDTEIIEPSDIAKTIATIVRFISPEQEPIVCAQSFGTIMYGWLTNFTDLKFNRALLVDPVCFHLLSSRFQSQIAFKHFSNVIAGRNIFNLIFWSVLHMESLRETVSMPQVDGLLMRTNVNKLCNDTILIYGTEDHLIESDIHLLKAMSGKVTLRPHSGSHVQLHHLTESDFIPNN